MFLTLPRYLVPRNLALHTKLIYLEICKPIVMIQISKWHSWPYCIRFADVASFPSSAEPLEGRSMAATPDAVFAKGAVPSTSDPGHLHGSVGPLHRDL